nr:MAG TPA: hypothetical protein [Caudoviricetes sp.]
MSTSHRSHLLSASRIYSYKCMVIFRYSYLRLAVSTIHVYSMQL